MSMSELSLDGNETRAEQYSVDSEASVSDLEHECDSAGDECSVEDTYMVPRTAHEKDLQEVALEPVPFVVVPDDLDIEMAGVVYGVVENMLVVRSVGLRALDLDSVLCLGNENENRRLVLGRETKVYYVVAFASHVDAQKIKTSFPGCDASNLWDEEVTDPEGSEDEIEIRGGNRSKPREPTSDTFDSILKKFGLEMVDQKARSVSEEENEESGSMESGVGRKSSCIIYDLLDNPERFTGYSGSDAYRIWHAIYLENCHYVHGGKSIGNVFDAPPMNSCLERTLFYRIISGMHTSISTHLTSKYRNETTLAFDRNYLEYWNRVGSFQERKNNFYFAFMVIIRAIQKASAYLSLEHNFAVVENELEIQKIQDLISRICLSTFTKCPNLFNEQQLFQGSPDSDLLKKSFRQHFQNISRIIDCVGCLRCRLWSKIQIIGLGTALKILFSYESPGPDFRLSKTEVVALFNALGKFSETLSEIQYMDSAIANDITLIGQNVVLPEQSGFVLIGTILLLMVLALAFIFYHCVPKRFKRVRSAMGVNSNSK
ncbi:unnamed protein product [Sphagnum compactum]